MKTLHLILAFLLVAICTEAQTSVQWNLTDPQYGINGAVTNRYFTLQAINVNASGSITPLPFQLSGFTDTNGSITFSNLSGSYATGGFYKWTLPATGQPNQGQAYSGLIQVTSTNLGLVNANLISVNQANSGATMSWTTYTSDQRYAASSNQLGSYVQIGQLNSASNYIVSQFPTITNGYTSIVFSNPALYSTLPQVTNIVNSLATTGAIPSLSTITNIALSQANAIGLNDTNFTLYTSNSLSTNALAQLIATNNALVFQVNTFNTNLNSALATASNLLSSTKQPASSVLTNLAGTGAYTNILLAGQNVNLTTNGSGTTVFINATNQSFLTNTLGSAAYSSASSFISTNALPGLTNGFITSAALTTYTPLMTLTNYAYPSNNPSGFITGIATNALATTNFVATYADTNGAATAAIASFKSSAQPASATLTNLSGTGAFTNILAAGQNASLSTNFSGTIVSFNATNQIFLTNHILDAYSTTNQNNIWYDTNGAGLAAALAASNSLAAKIPSTNGFVTAAITNGLATTNFVISYSDTNGAAFSAANQATNGMTAVARMPLSAVTNTLATTNFVVLYSDTNGAALEAFNSATNFSATNTAALIQLATNISYNFVASTNGSAYNMSAVDKLRIGAKSVFVVSTNLIGVYGGAGGNGTYEAISSTVWTNVFTAPFWILSSAGNYYLNSNGVTLYQTTNVNGSWTIVSGSYPVPSSAFGAYLNTDGLKLVGVVDSSNMLAQIGGYSVGGVVSGAVTNESFSQTGTNVIIGLINLYGVNPTNGVTLTNVQALLAQSNYLFAVGGVGTNLTFNGVNTAAVLNVTGYIDMRDGWITNVQGISITRGVTLYGDDRSEPFGANSIYIGQGSGHPYGETNTFIAGGYGNDIGELGNSSAIVGGLANRIGIDNVPATEFSSFIGGGNSNTVKASFSATLGGISNTVTGNSSIAMGSFSAAAHNNSFVWNDATDNPFQTVATNTFIINSANGVAINTNNPSGYALNVAGTINATNILINGSPISGGGTNGNWIANSNGLGTNLTLVGTIISDNANYGTNVYGGYISTLGVNNQGSGNDSTPAVSLPSYEHNTAFGTANIASGGNAFAIGLSAFASGGESFAGGRQTIASGLASIALGGSAQATNDYSFVWSSYDGNPKGSPTNNSFAVFAQNGVTINATNANGNALEVNGTVDSTVGYTVNGIPITWSARSNLFIFGTNFISGTWFFSSSNAIGSVIVYSNTNTKPLFIGVYNPTVWPASGSVYWTNSTGQAVFDQGFKLAVSGGVYSPMLLTNDLNQLSTGIVGDYYQSTTLVNPNWEGVGGTLGTSAGTMITNIISGDVRVAINTNSSGTNTLEVNGNIDSTVGYTINGQPLSSFTVTQSPLTNAVTNFSVTLSQLPAGVVTNGSFPKVLLPLMQNIFDTNNYFQSGFTPAALNGLFAWNNSMGLYTNAISGAVVFYDAGNAWWAQGTNADPALEFAIDQNTPSVLTNASWVDNGRGTIIGFSSFGTNSQNIVGYLTNYSVPDGELVVCPYTNLTATVTNNPKFFGPWLGADYVQQAINTSASYSRPWDGVTGGKIVVVGINYVPTTLVFTNLTHVINHIVDASFPNWATPISISMVADTFAGGALVCKTNPCIRLIDLNGSFSPPYLRLQDLIISSLDNSATNLVELQTYSRADIVHNWFGWWTTLTNNYVSGFPVGLSTPTTYDKGGPKNLVIKINGGADMLNFSDNSLLGMASVYLNPDHAVVDNNFFSFCGAQQGTSSWLTNSIYMSGACVIFGNNANGEVRAHGNYFYACAGAYLSADINGRKHSYDDRVEAGIGTPQIRVGGGYIMEHHPYDGIATAYIGTVTNNTWLSDPDAANAGFRLGASTNLPAVYDDAATFAIGGGMKYYGNGTGLTNLNGSQVQGAVPLSTAAATATNLVSGASLTNVTAYGSTATSTPFAVVAPVSSVTSFSVTSNGAAIFGTNAATGQTIIGPMGGLHVGGTTSAGASNAIVEGNLSVNGTITGNGGGLSNIVTTLPLSTGGAGTMNAGITYYNIFGIFNRTDTNYLAVPIPQSSSAIISCRLQWSASFATQTNSAGYLLTNFVAGPQLWSINGYTSGASANFTTTNNLVGVTSVILMISNSAALPTGNVNGVLQLIK